MSRARVIRFVMPGVYHEGDSALKTRFSGDAIEGARRPTRPPDQDRSSSPPLQHYYAKREAPASCSHSFTMLRRSLMAPRPTHSSATPSYSVIESCASGQVVFVQRFRSGVSGSLCRLPIGRETPERDCLGLRDAANPMGMRFFDGVPSRTICAGLAGVLGSTSSPSDPGGR